MQNAECRMPGKTVRTLLGNPISCPALCGVAALREVGRLPVPLVALRLCARLYGIMHYTLRITHGEGVF